ncbi:MAG: cysteine hydrolase [Candidatus Devosia phytovorans]|uniref:Cysteine hydrolase n=1 Tax=Candidatus Devosia phytovorans TaxID=3121372 RepID=A0AAJ5VWM6_9HYPH|nr:cysteine hydrolase [Devosia sp.]WEK05280.1 MAG: cysteine hydrolase [Devosia sp.]
MTEKRSALLVMDFQHEIVAGHDAAAAIANTKMVLDAARKARVPVAYVVVGFRPGYPEVSANNKGFSAVKAAGRLVNPSVIDELAPIEGEPVVTKHRVGALYGTDLPVILSAFGANHLVLTGISTSGVILSTTRMAADMDFAVTILADCVGDNDPAVHDFLLTKILPRQAEISDSASFIASIS